jgi:hypothetical protein
MSTVSTDPVTYAAAAFAGTPVTVVTGKYKLAGLICTVANTGGIVVYDNDEASGSVVYQVASLTQGQVVSFPSEIICNTGITVALTTDGTVNVLYA